MKWRHAWLREEYGFSLQVFNSISHKSDNNNMKGNCFAGKQNFSLNKAKKENKFVVESLDQCRCLEVREKARNVFLRWAYVFLTTRCYKEFNKTIIIIPFVLVGYETGYSQLGATPLFGYLPSHIQRALME